MEELFPGFWSLGVVRRGSWLRVYAMYIYLKNQVHSIAQYLKNQVNDLPGQTHVMSLIFLSQMRLRRLELE
jgi:hypothetical protein